MRFEIIIVIIFILLFQKKDIICIKTEYIDESPGQNCSSLQFTCKSGFKHCIPLSWKCDHYKDCFDGSDELNCAPCSKNEMICNNDNTCISLEWICDEDFDCSDGEDESPTLCKSAYLYSIANDTCTYLGAPCENSPDVCIKFNQLCDGVIDCPFDSSDEGPQCYEEISRRALNCSYSSTMLPSNVSTCYCPEGQILNSDNRTCKDADICLLTKPCEQVCISLKSGWEYDCLCEAGFVPSQVDHRLCQLPNSRKTFDYLIATTKVSIQKILFNGSISLSSNKTLNSTAVDFNFAENKVCWISENLSRFPTKLICAKLDDFTVLKEVLLPDDMLYASRLAIDWLTDNFYFLNGLFSQLTVCNLTNSPICLVLDRIELASVQYLDLALDPYAGFLFCAIGGKFPKILRMDMNGRNKVAILYRGIAFPTTIALDRYGQQVYIHDASFDTLQSIDYDGNFRKHLWRDGVLPKLTSLTYFNSSLYFWSVQDHSLIKLNPWLNQKTSIAVNSTDLLTLHAVDSMMQRRDPSHGCKQMRCDHLCLIGRRINNQTSGSCFCAAGYTLSSDGSNCKSFPENKTFLLYSKSSPSGIKAISLDAHPLRNQNNTFFIRTAKDILAMDYFRDKNDVNWLVVADKNKPGTISQAPFQSHTRDCSSLAVDWLNFNLYWIDDDFKAIRMTSLEERSPTPHLYFNMYRFVPSRLSRKTLVEREAMHPKSITLLPTKGYMYWTLSQLLRPGRIERAWMDGSHQEVFLSEKNLSFPTGLAVDESRGILYWVDAYLDSIFSMNLDKTGRKILFSGKSPHGNLISHPVSAAFFENNVTGISDLPVGRFLFWVEYRKGFINRLNLDLLPRLSDKSTNAIQLVASDTSPLFINLIFDPARRIGHSFCQKRNCSDFCVPIPYPPFYKCLCPDHKLLTADNRTCELNRNYTTSGACPAGYFHCKNNYCITDEYVCDADDDCRDNSDEHNDLCNNYTCPGDRFYCNSSRTCIYLSWVCDGDRDCDGGEDESFETCTKQTCPSTHYKCPSGECIQRNWICDDDQDCSDGSDETSDCPLPSCNPGAEFTCRNGRCVSIEWLCDDDDDCDDGSDEENCRTAPPSFGPTSAPNASACLNRDDVVCGDGVDCVPKEWRCDGDDDCRDAADERDCENLPCRAHTRSCGSGSKCIFTSWWCDGEEECPDGSDESNCTCPFVAGDQYRQIRCFTASYVYKCVNVCDGELDCVLGHDEENCTLRGPTCADQVCSHMCRDTSRGVLCSCPKGKELASDERTCRGISYCSRMGSCSQNCTGSGPSYRCSCYEGWHVDPNHPRGNICAYDKTDPPLFIIYATQHSIKYFSLDDNFRIPGHRARVLLGSLRYALSIDFHYEEMLLFYVDVSKKTISRASIRFNDGRSLGLASHRVIMQKQTGKLEGLSVDWIAGRVYFIDLDLHQIEVMGLDGGHRSVLVAGNMDNPRALCLDPRYGLMFWTVWSLNKSSVERASMDGTNRTAIWKKNGWPNGLTLDYLEERVYWAGAKANAIWSSKYNGSDLMVILANVDWLTHPFSLTTYAHRLFWTDWTTTVIAGADKWPNRNTTILEVVYHRPFDIKAFHETRQPRTVRGSNRVIKNPCSDDPCSHLCVIVPGEGGSITFRCVCPHQLELDPDQRTCEKMKSFLLLSQPYRIAGLRLNNLNFSAIFGVNFYLPFVRRRVAYDASRNQVYWTQERPMEIKRSFLNGTGIETVVGIDSTLVYGLAVDWLRGLIFWTSYRVAEFGSRLHVASSDGRFQHRLDSVDPVAWSKIDQARYLTADVSAAVLYFASGGSIYSINMDGSSLEKIHEGPTADKRPITDLHFHNGSLYFVSGEHVARLYTCSTKWCKKNISLPVSALRLAVSTEKLLWIYDSHHIYNCTIGADASCDRQVEYALISDLVVFDSNLQKGRDLENLPCASGNSGCSQICLPSGGRDSNGWTCQCTVGFKPDPDNSSLCVGLDEFLVYSRTSRINGINLRNDASALMSVVDQRQVVGVDFYAENETIIWAESGTSSLKAALRNMTSKWLIYSAYDGDDEYRKSATSSNYHRFEGLAVDWMGKNLYWVDTLFKEVKVVRMDGSFPFTVYKGLSRMRGLAVHPARAVLFVSSWVSSGSITRMKLDGSNPDVVVSNAGWPNGLTIDYDNNRLYWCDAHVRHKAIKSSTLDGRNTRAVYSPSSGRMYGISFFDGRLYWSDSLTKTGSIYSCPADSCTKSNLTVLASGLGTTIKDVVVYSSKRQAGKNICSKLNGGCEQLCFYLGSNSRRCACSYGRLNKADNKTCLAWNHFLLFSTQTRIHSINVDNPLSLNDPFPLMESNLVKAVVVMTSDYDRKRVFYSDMSDKTISFFPVSYKNKRPSSPTVLLRDVGTVEGLAYHKGENALYWTSFDDQTIKKHLLHSNTTVVVVPSSNRSDRLRALVLFECERPNLMFWTNWNEDDPSVSRATTDGSNKTKLISTAIKTPNGLALDTVTKLVYWADATLDKIERCDFDGRNRKVIVASGLEHVFSLALMGEFLYWSDWRRDELVRVNKWTGTGKETLREFTFNRLMGVLAFYNDSCIPNPCRGQCRYSCVVSLEGEAVCVCPDGSMSDHCGNSLRGCPPGHFDCLDSHASYHESNCIPYEVTCDGRADCPNRADESPHYCNTRTCRNGTWLCSNNDRCIARDLVCDGFDNCLDGFASDEQGCGGSSVPSTTPPSVLCRPGMFMCADARSCLPISYVCDNEKDCSDGSDEVNCSSSGCIQNYFRCSSSLLCIPFRWLCDGDDDCRDGSDELSCGDNLCGVNQFECRSPMSCIDASWRCDRDRDCDDGSDEEGCEYPPCDGLLCDDGTRCVQRSFICDGDHDCVNGTDEQNCSTPALVQCDPIRELICPDSNQCLPRHRACDGIADCHPPVDEINCHVDECSDPATNKCPHLCVEWDYSYTCQCYDGYELETNNSYSCVDIDECSEAFPYPPCSQVCTNVKGSYICSCTTGYRRSQLKSSDCLAQPSYPKPFLIFSMSKFIMGTDLKSTIRHRQLFARLGHVVGLDFDWLEQYIYWSNVGKDGAVIGRFDLSNRTSLHANGSTSFNARGSGEEVILSGLASVHGIAVDWVTRNLYWTELEKKLISVSKLNGRFRKTLFKSGLSKPRAIAVAPRKGYLFWTDWGTLPQIGRSGMDGSQRIILISNQTSVKALHWPNALTIDFASKRLFWADAAHHYIASCNYDGSSPRVVPFQHSQSVAHHINALAVFENEVYWNDWSDKSIKYADKFRGTHGSVASPFILEHSLPNQPMNLKIVHPLLQPMLKSPHPCTIKNGGCQDLCLIVPGGTYRCECPDNFYLSANKRSCLSNCSYVEFICKNHKCLPYWKKCDGVDDCGDNSDEPENCQTFYCSPGQYQCPESNEHSFKCINPSGLCDGVKECPNGMDEYDCAHHICLHDQFKCDKSTPPRCVPITYRCNGAVECDNGEDEADCAVRKCSEIEYKCKPVSTGSNQSSIMCLPQSRVCDGDMDCLGGDDEQNCKPTTCDEGMYKCPDGPCIPISTVRNNELDCPDGSDETRDTCVVCRESPSACVRADLLCNGVKDCVDGEDERDCPHTKNCSSDYFTCKHDGRCVHRSLLCDDEIDCADGSDEEGCAETSCGPSQFRCEGTRVCIPLVSRCDGIADCFNATDEINCRAPTSQCESDMYRCEDSMCIPFLWTCDGSFDCFDHSDEGPFCSSRACPLDRPFRCSDVCLSLEKVCDGILHCFDGRDENRDCYDRPSHTSDIMINSTHCRHFTSNSTAPEPGFVCPDESCVSTSSLCDGVADCPSGYDERYCGRGTCSDKGSCSELLHSVCFPLPPQAAGGLYKSYCQCKKGFVSRATGLYVKCADVDECQDAPSCSQTCINTIGSYRCVCNDGWDLFNKTDCRFNLTRSKAILLHTTPSSPLRLQVYDSIENQVKYVDNYTFNAFNVILSRLVSADMGHTIYGSDLSNGIYKIRRIDAEKIVELPAGHRVSGLSIDESGSNIFWVDSGAFSVNMMKVKAVPPPSNERRSIVNRRHLVLFNRNNSVLHRPLDVAVQHYSDHIFVSNWNEEFVGAIYKFDLKADPSNHILLVSDLGWPVSLSVDLLGLRVYWCDAKLRKISFCSFDGRTCRTIFGFSNSFKPNVISVFGDFVFVSLSNRNALLRVHKLSNLEPISQLSSTRSDWTFHPDSVKWITYASSRPMAYLVLHHPFYTPDSLSGCRDCTSVDSDGFCMNDGGSLACMCRYAPHRGFQRCSCSPTGCENGTQCVGASCGPVGTNYAVVAGFVVFLVVLLLVLGLVWFAYKRSFDPSRFYRRLIGRSRADVGDVSYRQLIVADSLATSRPSMDSASDGALKQANNKMVEMQEFLSGNGEARQERAQLLRNDRNQDNDIDDDEITT